MKTLVENRRLLYFIGINLDKDATPLQKLRDFIRNSVIGLFLGFVLVLNVAHIISVAVNQDSERFKRDFYLTNGYMAWSGMYLFLRSNRIGLSDIFESLDRIVWKSEYSIHFISSTMRMVYSNEYLTRQDSNKPV